MEYQTYPLNVKPTAHPEAIIQSGDVRFTVLTDRLIRLEHDPAQRFEDHPSFAIWFREQDVPTFTQRVTDNRIEITTPFLHLAYNVSPNGFTQQTLTIEVKSTGTTWHYGDRDHQNLRGTGRTLDEADGPIHLEEGLLSRSGWAILDDSSSLVLDDKGWPMARPATTGEGPETKDLYFLGYGHEYLQCLKDYCRVSGKVPMLPRYVLGNWWSRYWEFSDLELKGLMTSFKENEIPLSVCIVDMDWHITKTGNFSSGWTGYTWNKDLFPDPPAFINWLHQQGLKTALNLHPADGVHPHEEDYPEMAQAMGIDPKTQTPVPFDIADPEFAYHYFNILHHPKEEKDGIDFWWMDWQQGVRVKNSKHPVSKYMDPLFWLNHLHFFDLQRDGSSRGFVFSRWGGMGNHRYPIGFSGDSVVSWKSLAFQPYFTANASNVAYAWWSHDIGGHMGGVENAELYTRWVQYGVFSPIFRLHCTKNSYQNRAPWAFGEETLEIAKKYMQLRHKLIPYIYTMSWRNYAKDVPFIQPMYYAHPENELAYRVPNQYYFGSELLAAPITQPVEASTQQASQTIWLPEGEWYDFFTGQHFTGGRFVTVYGDQSDCPIFAPAGAIVPMDARNGWGSGVSNPDHFEVNIFAGEEGQFDLFEDDGISYGYAKGSFSQTSISQTIHQDSQSLSITIAPVSGKTDHLADKRRFDLHIFGLACPETVTVTINGKSTQSDSSYDPTREVFSLLVPAFGLHEKCEIQIDSQELFSHRDRRTENIQKFLRMANIDSWIKIGIDQHIPVLLQDASLLNTVSQELTAAQIKAIFDILAQ